MNHPNHTFIIGLVDKISDKINFDDFNKFTILPVAKLAIENFEVLNKKYNITELSTSVKPSYFNFIFQNYDANKVLYLDPDILVTSTFKEILDELETNNIVITPHMCSPIDDEFAPTDYHVLGGGVFNLGFIGLSDYLSVKKFLSWWNDRVIKYGYRDYCRGMFYDQLWINYVPCFFDNFKIIKHLGYNMANWNFHERTLTKNEKGQYCVNGKVPLRFFHFSSYKYMNKNEICWYQNRYDFINRPDLKDIYYEYHDLITINNVEKYYHSETYYYPKRNNNNLENTNSANGSVFMRMYKRLKKAIRVLIRGN